jgi:hypothetical protein
MKQYFCVILLSNLCVTLSADSIEDAREILSTSLKLKYSQTNRIVEVPENKIAMYIAHKIILKDKK